MDPRVNDYVKNVGLKLAAVSDQPNLPYDFVVLNDDTPNAWACPAAKLPSTEAFWCCWMTRRNWRLCWAMKLSTPPPATRPATVQSYPLGPWRCTADGGGVRLRLQPLIGAGVGLGVGMTAAKFGRDQG